MLLSDIMFKTYFDKLNESAQRKQESINEQQAILNTYNQFFRLKLAILNEKYDLITSTLKTIGFEIESINPNIINWEERININLRSSGSIDEIKLSCNCRLKMIGRRKPFQKCTYDKQQNDRMEKSARKAVQQFKEATGIGCGLNKYSLDKATDILFDFSL